MIYNLKRPKCILRHTARFIVERQIALAGARRTLDRTIWYFDKMHVLQCIAFRVQHKWYTYFAVDWFPPLLDAHWHSRSMLCAAQEGNNIDWKKLHSCNGNTISNICDAMLPFIGNFFFTSSIHWPCMKLSVWQLDSGPFYCTHSWCFLFMANIQTSLNIDRHRNESALEYYIVRVAKWWKYESVFFICFTRPIQNLNAIGFGIECSLQNEWKQQQHEENWKKRCSSSGNMRS